VTSHNPSRQSNLHNYFDAPPDKTDGEEKSPSRTTDKTNGEEKSPSRTTDKTDDEEKSPPRNKTKTLPTPRIFTLNTTSLSVKARESKKRIITRLFKRNDIGIFQETKLFHSDKDSLDYFFPDCKVFYCNNPDNTSDDGRTLTAGLVIVVTNDYLKTHTVKPTFEEVLEDHRGHIQALHFSQDENRYSFDLINLRLATGDPIARKAQLSVLNDLPHSPHPLILGGDFNFAAETDEGPSQLTADHLADWNTFLDKQDLHEVYQSLPTFYANGPDEDPTSKRVATRIDRFYIRWSEAHWHLSRPLASCLVPKRALSPSFNGHGSVELKFSSVFKNKRDPSIPLWLAEEDRYEEFFQTAWESHGVLPTCAFELADLFKKTAFLASDTVKDYINPPRDQLGRFFSANKLFTLINAKTQNRSRITAFLEKYPELYDSVKFQGFQYWDDGLSDQINSFYNTYADPEFKSDPFVDFRPPARAKSSDSSNILKQLKLALPSSKRPIRTLRESETEEAFDDPQEMARITVSYYKPLWTSRDGTRAPAHLLKVKTFLGKFCKKISKIPEKPTIELVREAILESGNSSAGPDGIPFVVYRKMINIAAPILHGILLQLMDEFSGSLADFNLARLVLIAKKDTGLVSDTRPISINNAENRLIATAIVLAIMPVCDELCTSRQKLFIKGRKSTDHLKELNEYFYSDEGIKKWALFLDTAKAFSIDSIDHNFILETLRTQGFPQWLLNAVTNLLKDVHTFPSTSTNRTPLIPVSRGVKQGCPLSPILFVLCYEPFLQFLSPTNTPVSLLAAADDICLYSSSLTELIESFPKINYFSEISGLGVNDDKTHVICSQVHTHADEQALKDSVWPKTTIVSAAKYLGILFGKDVTTSDLYEPILAKAQARLASYRPVLRRLTLYKKVLVVNTFVTTLFSYLYQFFIIPKEVRENYDRAVTGAVIPYAGKGYILEHLYAPTTLGGLKQPLKDLWALNMQALVRQRGFGHIHSSEDLSSIAHGEWDTQAKPKWIWSSSMRIRFHEDNATHDYLNSHSDWSPNNADTFKRTNKKIYKDIMSASRNLVVIEDTTRLLGRYVDEDEAEATATRFHDALGSIGKKLPDRIHATQLQLLANSTPTTWRTRMIPKIRDTAAVAAGFPCKLCGQPKDWIEHIYTPSLCSTTKKAILSATMTNFLPLPTLEALANSETPLFTHDYLTDMPLSCDLVRTVMCLSWAIWKAYTETSSGLQPSKAASRIVSLFTSSFSSGEKDKDLMKEEKRVKFLKFLTTLPQDNIKVYTDGSANPNPGPCGAGAIIYFPDGFIVRLFQPLDLGSNNRGEAWAVGMGLQYLEEKGHVSDQIDLFTDSKITLGQLESGWKFKTNKKALHALQKIRARFKCLSIYKVPAHCNIEGNEEADVLAELGSSLSPPDVSPELFSYSLRSPPPSGGSPPTPPPTSTTGASNSNKRPLDPAPVPPPRRSRRLAALPQEKDPDQSPPIQIISKKRKRASSPPTTNKNQRPIARDSPSLSSSPDIQSFFSPKRKRTPSPPTRNKRSRCAPSPAPPPPPPPSPPLYPIFSLPPKTPRK
jgi:ribonuclease HI